MRRGDRVALFLENGIEMVAGVYAALGIGAVFMPISPLTKGDKLAYLLDDAPRAHWSRRPRSPRMGIRPGGERDRSSPPWLRAPPMTSRRAAGATPALDEHFDAPGIEQATLDQDLASIIYTSGSTGLSKGVMLTHLNMESAASSVGTYLGPRRRRDPLRAAALLRLRPVSGVHVRARRCRAGARAHFAFPVKVLESLARERATVFPGVPTMFSTLTNLDGVDEFDLSALRMMTNTAAALSEEHIRQLRALLPGATLFSMYGLTECKRVTYLPPEQLDIRPASVGRGMPNEEVWLVDDAGRRLPNGTTGELVIRG